MQNPMNLWRCSACSSEIDAASRFCSKCGTEQVLDTDGDVFADSLRTASSATPPLAAETPPRYGHGGSTNWPRAALAAAAAVVVVGGGLALFSRSSSPPAPTPSTTTARPAPGNPTTGTTAPDGTISRATGYAIGLRSDGTMVRVDLATGRTCPLEETVAAETRFQSLHTNGTDIIAMSQGSVSVISASATEARVDLGVGDRVITSPGGRWVVAEEMDPSEAAPLAWRRGQSEAASMAIAPGMAIVGIAGDEVVLSGGGSIFLLNPTTGQSRFVAAGIPIATADDVLVRSVCSSPTNCEIRWGPWDDPNRAIRPLPDSYRGMWAFPGFGVLSPDRSKVAALDTSYGAQRVRVLDLERGTETSFPAGSLVGRFPTVSFSEDGLHIVHVNRERVEGATGRIVISPLDGSTPTSLDLGDLVSVTVSVPTATT